MDSLLTDIDHVAIAVRNLDEAIAWYVQTFSAEVVHREEVEHDGVSEVLMKAGDSYIQLLTPTRSSSTVAMFLDRRGEGVHHVAYRVNDCAEALTYARASGARVIDEVPRRGSRGTTIAFLHPTCSFGTLIELVQENLYS